MVAFDAGAAGNTAGCPGPGRTARSAQRAGCPEVAFADLVAIVRPLYAADLRASRTLSAWASTVTTARPAAATPRSCRPSQCPSPGRAPRAAAPMSCRTRRSARRRSKSDDLAQLKDPEVAAERVERFVRRKSPARARREGPARASPSLESGRQFLPLPGGSACRPPWLAASPLNVTIAIGTRQAHLPALIAPLIVRPRALFLGVAVRERVQATR